MTELSDLRWNLGWEGDGEASCNVASLVVYGRFILWYIYTIWLVVLGSITACSVTASLLVTCMRHGWSSAAVLSCRLPILGRRSCRYRTGMAWMQLSRSRVSHSVILRDTEEVVCCIPPCSRSSRLNWWSTWLARMHPVLPEHATWSSDVAARASERKVFNTSTGTIQNRPQWWAELSPYPQATQHGKFLLVEGQDSNTSETY